MNLALRELRRRPGRFAAATAILFLLGGLQLFLGGLIEGLNANNSGVLRVQQSELIVYANSAEKTVNQSLLSADDVARVTQVDGVSKVGMLSVELLGVRLPGRSTRDLLDVVLVGFDLPIQGAAVPPAEGEGLADTTLRDRGVRIGMDVAIGPARTPIRIVGYLPPAGLQGQGGIWVGPQSYAAIVAADAPSDALPAGATQALVVQTEGDPAAVAARIDAATGSTQTLTTPEAAAAIPDVGGGVLNTIVYLTIAISVAVVALFFALLTAERVGLYGVLKAIGARTRTLFAGLLLQAVVLAAIASSAALVVAIGFDAIVPPDGIPFTLSFGQAAFDIGALFVASAVGAAFSLRRVTRIDPAAAIGTNP